MIFLKVPVGISKTATLTMEKNVRRGTNQSNHTRIHTTKKRNRRYRLERFIACQSNRYDRPQLGGISNSYIANKRGFVQIIPPSWGMSYQFDWHAIHYYLNKPSFVRYVTITNIIVSTRAP